jgi:putative ABC transport system substrate-binding protein
MTARVTRRHLLATGAAWLASPRVIRAHATERKPRIGFTGLSSPGLDAGMLRSFQERLRELGYEDGRNVEIVYRWADGAAERYPKLAVELVHAGVDVLVTGCDDPLRAVRQVDPTIPVVLRCIDLSGFRPDMQTLTRPGGFTTGATYFSPRATQARLQLLKDALPGLTDVALLERPRSDWGAFVSEIDVAARAVGVRVHRVAWQTSAALPDAFRTIAIDVRAGAVLTLADNYTYGSREAIFKAAADQRVPVLYDFSMFPAFEPGLMSYTVRPRAIMRAVVDQVDQILKGRRPGDIPIEQPDDFQFIFSPRAARALALTLPPAVLARVTYFVQ